MDILVLNPGSSSLKFALFSRSGANFQGEAQATASEMEVRARGVVERIGTPAATLRLTLPDRKEQAVAAPTVTEAAQQAFSILAPFIQSGGRLDALACRVVHGGARFVAPTRMTPDTLNQLRSLDDLAPLHNRPAIAVMEAAQQTFPDIPLVAVFDTAFHQTLPEVAYTYALPTDLAARYGLRRYGFHGISHRYVSAQLLKVLKRPASGSRLITCHLGSGASVCALRDGKSVDTSMGLTPLEGLVMGTRSGDLDPGLVLHLLRVTGQTVEQLETLLNHESGLAGVSGRGSDVRDLKTAADQGDARAGLALELFAYRCAKYIGAYFVALEGLDGVAFAGGIGEHAPAMRERICRRLAAIGLRLDPARNGAADGSAPAQISADNSPVAAWVIPTNEELQIAHETANLLSQSSDSRVT